MTGWLASPPIPGKIMEEKFLEIISKHMMDKKVIERSQYGFLKAKSCLTDLIAFYNEKAALVDEQRAMDVVYLGVSKVSNAVSCKTLVDELMEVWTR